MVGAVVEAFEQGVGAVELVAGGEVLADGADVGAAGDAVLQEPTDSTDRSMRLPIGHYLEGRAAPCLG